MKEYKKQIIVTSMVILIPLVVGILLWNRLPDRMATHFGAGNVPNNWSSKTFTVICLPLLMLGLHLFTILVTLNDPRKQNIGKKMLGFIFWIIPSVALISVLSTYGYALEMAVDIEMICNLMVGMIFLVMGNYMSKNRQNYTVGIRLPWTLHSQENWNRTHRLASKMWILAGVIFIGNVFFGSVMAVILMIGVMVIVPFIYSFVLYKKGI